MKYVGIGGKCMLGNRSFAGSQNAQNSLTQVNTVRKTWSDYRKHKRYIDFAAKMVLTEFWLKVGT
jgi:hypothetical protein